MKHEHVIMFSDGGARGNPGPGAAGAVIYSLDKKTELATVSEYLGDMVTNNQAEYQAVFLGLQQARELGAKRVDCFLDSELITNQLLLKYRVKNSDLQAWFTKTWNLTQGFSKVTFTHVPRADNKRADQLVNQALDMRLGA